MVFDDIFDLNVKQATGANTSSKSPGPTHNVNKSKITQLTLLNQRDAFLPRSTADGVQYFIDVEHQVCMTSE